MSTSYKLALAWGAVHNENRARKIEGLPQKTKYGGQKIDPNKLRNPPNLKTPKVQNVKI
jgi:hypothetical protein